jgi:hypothetical protein
MKRVRPEESFQSAVVYLAQLRGWLVAHFRKARTKTGWITAVGGDGKGWPDLFLCHPARGVAIARELKVPPNRATPEQEAWLLALRECGIDAKVWTPADWPEIEMTLLGPQQSPRDVVVGCEGVGRIPDPRCGLPSPPP